MSSPIPREIVQRPRNRVDDFGARCDSTADGGGTDDTVSIQGALDAAETDEQMQATVIVPAGKFCRITAQLVVPSTVDLICEGDGTIVYDNTDNTTAILVGATDELYQRRRLRINLKRATTSTWLSESSIGVAVCNPVESEMDFARVDGFTVGIQWKAHLAAAYNYGIRLGRILNNKFGIDLHSFDANGFPNENHFIGGRFSYSTGTNTGLSRYAIRFKSESGAYANHNNNVFDGFTVELSDSQASPGVARAVLIENNAILNKFVNYRTELNTEPHIEITGAEAGRNIFRPLFNNQGAFPLPTDFILWSGNRKTDHIESPEAGLFRVQSEWHSGDLLLRSAIRAVDATFSKINTIGVHWEVFAGSGATSLVQTVRLAPDGDYLVPSGSNPAAGIIVDTNRNKRFVARKQTKSGAPGRFVIRCYDGHPLDGGSILDGASTQYVRGMQSGTDPAWQSTGYGGTFAQGADVDADWFFTVTDAVKFICVLCQNSSIAGFSVGAIDPYPIRAFPLHGVDDGRQYLDAAPDVGTYRRGQTVYNSAPGAGQPEKWTCTVAGSSGTWGSGSGISQTQTWDPPSTNSGAMGHEDFTVTGANPGDRALAAFSANIGTSVALAAAVVASDTVRVYVINLSGSPVDLSSGTLTIQVLQ